MPLDPARGRPPSRCGAGCSDRDGSDALCAWSRSIASAAARPNSPTCSATTPRRSSGLVGACTPTPVWNLTRGPALTGKPAHSTCRGAAVCLLIGVFVRIAPLDSGIASQRTSVCGSLPAQPASHRDRTGSAARDRFPCLGVRLPLRGPVGSHSSPLRTRVPYRCPPRAAGLYPRGSVPADLDLVAAAAETAVADCRGVPRSRGALQTGGPRAAGMPP